MRTLVRAGAALALGVAVACGQDGDLLLLKRGTQLLVGADRAVGLVELEPAAGERPARARLTVSAGPYSLVAQLAPGQRLHVGGAALEVVTLEPAAVRLRRAPGGAEADPLRAAPAGAAVRLDELAIHTLRDGRAVGVGNVRRDGPEGAPVVTLAVFPAGYREDPTRGYDLHPDVRAGAALSGRGGRVRVRAVEPGEGERPGTVALELPPG
ncbi:MAG: hypothetical protein KF878_04055 [Planctomycetes bacterium]|nr:hypothetical protein [Planctomycetota bacterium]